MFDYFLQGIRKKNYANFSGRSSRKEFWGFTATVWLILLVGMLLPLLLLICEKYMTLLASLLSIASNTLVILFFVFCVAILLPCLAITVRRLHDSNNTGWLLLILTIPYVGFILFLVVGALPSTEGANKFDLRSDQADSAGTMLPEKTASGTVIKLGSGVLLVTLGFGLPIAYLDDFHGSRPVSGVVVRTVLKKSYRHYYFNSRCRYPIVAYTVNNKQYESSYEQGCLTGNYYVGKRVRVLYAKNNPSYSIVKDSFTNITVPLIMGVFGLVLLVIAIARSRSARGK
jgi:uncharacterized membrane protein YhaH (DUF805 family)